MAGQFVRKSITAIVIKIAAAGLSFVMFVTLARAMPQHEFGAFGFAFSLATFLAVAGSLGQRNLVLKYASVYFDKGDHQSASDVATRGYRLVSMGVGALAVFLIATTFLPFLENYRAVILATACLLPILAIAEYQPHVLRAAGHVAWALMPRDIALRVGMIGLSLLVILGFAPTLTAVTAIFTMSGILAVLIVIQALNLKSAFPSCPSPAPMSHADEPKWRHTMWGLWGNSVVNASGRNMAMIIVGFMLPAAAVGAFFAALRTAMVLELFLLAINIVAAPMLAAKLNKNDTAGIQALCRKISLMLCVPTVGVFLIFAFAGDQVLQIFGIQYVTSHPELMILATGYLISAIAGPTTQLMEMGGFERSYFRMLTITTGVTFVILPFAIHLHSGIGAALCIAGNLVALNVWAYVFIHRQLGVSSGLVPLHTRSGSAAVTT